MGQNSLRQSRIKRPSVRPSVRPSGETKTKGPKDKKTTGPRTPELRNYETTGSETEVRGQSWLGSKRRTTGINGKLWENVGISGKNWEIVIQEWEIVGKNGKFWEV